jgi:hypothetical protein
MATNDTHTLPTEDHDTFATTNVRTPVHPRHEPPTNADGQELDSSQPRRARFSRRRRTMVSVALAATTFLGVGLGAAAPANADGVTLNIGSCESQYYGWEWEQHLNDGSWEPVTIWLPCVGGGAWYCWHWTGGCWWEQWPWRRP